MGRGNKKRAANTTPHSSSGAKGGDVVEKGSQKSNRKGRKGRRGRQHDHRSKDRSSSRSTSRSRFSSRSSRRPRHHRRNRRHRRGPSPDSSHSAGRHFNPQRRRRHRWLGDHSDSDTGSSSDSSGSDTDASFEDVPMSRPRPDIFIKLRAIHATAIKISPEFDNGLNVIKVLRAIRVGTMDLEDLPFPRMVVASDGKIYTPDNHILFVLRKLCLADEDVPMVPLPMTPAIQAAVDALPPVSSSHVEKTTTNSYYHHIKVDKKLRKAQNQATTVSSSANAPDDTKEMDVLSLDDVVDLNDSLGCVECNKPFASLRRLRNHCVDTGHEFLPSDESQEFSDSDGFEDEQQGFLN